MGKLIEAIQSLFKPKNESSSSQPSSANSGSSGGSSSGKSIAGFSFTPLGTSESGERPSPWAEVKKTTSTPKTTGNVAPFFGGTSTAKSVSSFVPAALPKDNGGSVQTEQKKSFLDYLKPVAQTGNSQPSVQTDVDKTKQPLIATPNYSWDQYKSDLNAIKQKTDNGIFKAKKEITQSEAQERATKTYNDRTKYYGFLMNNIDLGTDKGKADYKDLIAKLDTEIEAKARPKIGEDDGFFEFDAKALQWVKDDLVNRAREFELEQNRVSAQQYNDNIDSMIVATGVTSAPDYEVMSAKGMEAIEQKLASQRKRAEAMDEMYNRLVDPEGKTSGRVDLFASDWDDYDALSNEQKRLFGYIYATQGEDAAEDVFINFLGDVARYNQGVESTENMLSSDNAINRGFRKVLSGLPSTIATALSGWEQTIKNSSVEDNDKSQLFAGVSVDDMKRNIVANLGVDLYDEGVQRAAVNAWQNGGSTGEWYQELMANGSDEEKVLYNYLLAAYGEETAAQTYSVVQDDVDYITKTMQGSGALPIGSEQVRNQLLDDYYGMSGADSIFFDDMTRGQALNMMIDTASQQLFQKGIQLGISAIPGVGAFAKPISLALLGAQVYGNTYNAAKREGYSDRESAIYASAMGATEVAAELLLDGFTGYDGVLMKKINASTWVENIANPLMKGLVKAGFNAAGEGFEEVFSDVVEPLARGLILKDESASFDFSQAKDDFVAAAVTTLLMGAGGDISQEYGYSGYGESLSKMNATRKIIDTIQLVPVGQSKNQLKSYQEAQKIADGIMSGSLKATDNNVGRMTSAYLRAGGGLEFLANPMTACYTVDNISVDDMAAAATSRLVDLGGNTENPVTATAIAKTAKGASLTTEERAAFDAEKSASQIVEELSGDANSLEDNALTRAARASISGQTVQQKTYETLKQSNPQAHVADPATQYLLEQGVDQRQALAQGAIIAAVKDGVQVDAKTAGKIKLNSIPTQYVLMDQLGIEADATTTQAELMQMLNDKAAEFAALKMEQQELKAATKAQIKNETKQATKEAKRARLTAQMAAENGGANGEQGKPLEGNDVQGAVGVQGQSAQNMGENTPGNDGGRLGPYAADVGPGGRPVGESQPGGSSRRGEKFGRMDGGVRPSVVRGPGGLILNYEDPDASHTVDVADLLAGKAAIIGADGKLMPPDEQKKLGERCVATKRRLNKNGFYSVRFFFNTVDDYKAYGGRITKTDTGYNADICLNGRKFTLEQYARHETMHLWLRAFQFTKRAGGKKDDQIINRFYQFAKEVWGEKFEGAYKKQLEKYREQYPSRQDRANQREALGELLCIAYGAQDITGRDGSDPGVQERLQKWMKDNHIEAMGSGDMSDPYVQKAVKDGNYEPGFYSRQGFLTEENSADNLFGLARFTGPAKEEETREKPKKPRGRSNKAKNVETPIGIAFQSKEASERSQMVKNARDKLKGMSIDEREFLEDRYAQYKDVIDSLRVGDKFIQTEDDKSIMIGEVIAQDSRYVLISNSAGTEDSDLTLILKDHKKQNGAFISLTGETYFDDDVVIQYSSDEAYDNYEDYDELMSDSLEREGVRENDAAYEYGMFKEDSEATDKGMIGEEEETSAKLDKSLEEVDFSKMTLDEVTEYWNNFAVAQESMMDKTLEEDLAKEDEKQAKAEAKKRAKAEEKQKAKKAESPVAQAFKPKAESVKAEEPVAEKPKRGRPKGSKNKPKVTETAPAVETKVTETANPAAVFQEAPGQKTAPAMNDYWIRRTVTALTKDGKDGSVYSVNGETFIESGDGYMAVPVRVADVDRFKASTTLGEVTEPPVVTQGDNFTKLVNAPRVAVTADGRYYEFATEAGPVYFESKRFNYFDGAALEIGTMADGGHVLKATNQDGTIRGYLSAFDVDPASITEYKNAYGMKSFAEPKPKTEAKEPKTEAKEPKSEAQKPKKTEQKPKTEAKKPKAEAKKPAPEKTERDKAVAIAFAPKAKTTETKATETKAPTNATGLTFNNKVGNWVNNLANADNIRVARPNANRNTYQVVAFTKGKTYAYDDVSPSMLKKAFGKDKAEEIVSTATEMAGELASFDIEHAPVVDQKAAAAERAKKRAEEKAARERDTYGRLVSKGMMSFMQNSKARTDDSTDGALVPVYRVAEPGAVHNAKLIGGISIWTDKPAVANTWRGMKGAEAYGQTGKRIGPKGHRTTIDAAMTQLAELDPKSKEAAQYRALIAASERKLREYTNGVTRLDPWREAFSTPHDEDIVNGAALYECYLNLTNPLVVDAKGKGLAYVQEIAGKIQDSGYDGAIIHNVNGIVTDTNLGGGELDLSTVYITTKAGQGKSTLNTNPTDDALMQYSDDEFVENDFSDDESAENNYADGTLESNILNILHKAGNSEEASAALAEYVSNLLNTGEIPLVDAKTAAQERAANVFQPKVSREEHAVIRDQLDDLIEKYGAIPKGYKPQRDVAIPKSTDGETFVRNFVRTAIEAKGVTDASVELLERGVLQDQMLSHSVQTDKAAIANADRTIRKLGFQRALNEWRGRADGERAMTKNDVVLGECLMIAANKAGDLETGYQLAAELAEAGTNAGQVTQAFSILKKAPPAWQLYYINRVVNRMNTKYAKRINSGKMTQVVINRDLAKAVLRAKTQEDITTAMDALLDDIASQIPATYMDKWNAWRYLAMLGNPRTHIRNIVGNAIFTPAKFAKDMIAAGLESGFENAGFEFTRSKTTRPVSAERKAFAEADFEGIRDELQSGGKYNPENVIEQHRTIFGIPLLEMARKKNGYYLEEEDAIFLKHHYVNALGKYLEANNADLNWLRTTKDGARLLNAARQYAVLEARKATYRDASRVASALNSLKNVPGLGVLMEGAMPFTKTPVNILKRGVEYSPVGLIKTIAMETGKLKTGEINVNTYCDNLAAGMTGTGIMFLGAFLTSLGLLRGGPDDDDKKSEFDKLQGYQDYSITIGDQNFTIDWACPVAMPLFVGAELYKAFDKGDGLSNGDWMNLATVIAEPMTQLSMLSGLNDALSSAKYDKNPLSSVAVTLGTGYISQAFPTLLAQVSRSMVEDRRTTYVDKNSDVPAALQRWFQSNVMGKTPANASRAKYIDAWGRYDTDASLLVRLFDNMIAPWYRNTITTEPLEAELTRLSESVGTGVLMTAPERYVDWNNNRIDLTAEQYSDLALTRGQTLHIALDSLINSEAYSAMTDEQRAKAVENIKNYATYAGRKEVIPEYQADIYSWVDKCDGDPNRIENMAIMRSVANSLGVDADNNNKFYDLVIGADWMTPQEQGQILSQTYVTQSKTFKYGGKTYDLTPEVKAALYQEYRNEFPLYYAELAATEKWQTATGDKKLDLLADLRSDVAANCRKVIGAQLSNGTLGTPGRIGAFSYTDTLGNSSNLTGAGTLGQFPW